LATRQDENLLGSVYLQNQSIDTAIEEIKNVSTLKRDSGERKTVVKLLS
jgi:hypothetical protein